MSGKTKKDKQADIHIDMERLLNQMVFNSDTAPTIDEWLDESSDYNKSQNGKDDGVG